MPSESNSCRIIIHGGFFSESHTTAEIKKAKQDALKEIVEKGFHFLENHTALETVAYTVSLLEDCELFNAGTGSQIQSDGVIRMSAAIMDGVSKKFAGVMNIRNVRNPVLIAETLLETEDRVLGGEGANEYARKKDFEFFNPETPYRRKEYEQRLKSAGTGTVGCVALDSQGRLAAATSTGGKGFEVPGRISDSATTAGNFVNDFCGVSCTGVGEDIVRVALASTIVTRVTDGFTIDKAFEKSFAELKPFDGFAGAIAIDKSGNIHHLDSHPSMVFCSFDGAGFDIFD